MSVVPSFRVAVVTTLAALGWAAGPASAGLPLGDFAARYPAVARGLERARRVQTIKCVHYEYGYDGEPADVSDDLYVVDGSSFLHETTMVSPQPAGMWTFRANGGTADEEFRVLRDKPGGPPRLMYYSTRPTDVAAYGHGSSPVFAPTWVLNQRLADALADPKAHLTGVAPQAVDTYGRVIRVEYTYPDQYGTPLANAVYLDPDTWAIRGYQLSMLVHPAGKPPAHLYARVTYQTVAGVPMPLRVENWAESPARPGLRSNRHEYDVTACSLSVPAGVTFTLDKYGIASPAAARKGGGFRWFLWLNVLLLVVIAVYVYVRARRTARGWRGRPSPCRPGPRPPALRRDRASVPAIRSTSRAKQPSAMLASSAAIHAEQARMAAHPVAGVGREEGNGISS